MASTYGKSFNKMQHSLAIALTIKQQWNEQTPIPKIL